MTLSDHLARPVEPWRLDLIGAHLGSVRRHVPRLEARFPRHDVEPLAMQALYIAAFTYRPGPQSFHSWLRWKVRGSTAGLRSIERRRAARGIRIGSTRRLDIDERLYYRESPDA